MSSIAPGVTRKFLCIKETFYDLVFGFISLNKLLIIYIFPVFLGGGFCFIMLFLILHCLKMAIVTARSPVTKKQTNKNTEKTNKEIFDCFDQIRLLAKFK